MQRNSTHFHFYLFRFLFFVLRLKVCMLTYTLQCLFCEAVTVSKENIVRWFFSFSEIVDFIVDLFHYVPLGTLLSYWKSTTIGKSPIQISIHVSGLKCFEYITTLWKEILLRSSLLLEIQINEISPGGRSHIEDLCDQKY